MKFDKDAPGDKKLVPQYDEQVASLTAAQITTWSLETFGINRVALASSFGVEDQVLTDMICTADRAARIFTLDTGRHFEETYETWQRSVDKWHIRYEVCAPDPQEVAALVADSGPNLFYNSVEARKNCCAVRKTRPLDKVLSTVDAWIVGLRSEQAVTRTGLQPIEWDEVHGIYRISPLYNWTEAQVWEYIRVNTIPYNKLQDKGFRSIGCAPCTRAIGKDDDVRAGRWWWEEPQHKECGLHNRKCL